MQTLGGSGIKYGSLGFSGRTPGFRVSRLGSLVQGCRKQVLVRYRVNDLRFSMFTAISTISTTVVGTVGLTLLWRCRHELNHGCHPSHHRHHHHYTFTHTYILTYLLTDMQTSIHAHLSLAPFLSLPLSVCLCLTLSCTYTYIERVRETQSTAKPRCIYMYV